MSTVLQEGAPRAVLFLSGQIRSDVELEIFAECCMLLLYISFRDMIHSSFEIFAENLRLFNCL